jgi:hypothetical protein
MPPRVGIDRLEVVSTASDRPDRHISRGQYRPSGEVVRTVWLRLGLRWQLRFVDGAAITRAASLLLTGS